jgi:hypothetical protein
MVQNDHASAHAQVYRLAGLTREAGLSLYVTTPDGDLVRHGCLAALRWRGCLNGALQMTSVGSGATYLLDVIFEYEVLAATAYNSSWQRLADVRWVPRLAAWAFGPEWRAEQATAQALARGAAQGTVRPVV